MHVRRIGTPGDGCQKVVTLNFDTLGLSPRILKALPSLGLDTPTPIQAEAIPAILRGRDIMGLAQTGTGKTAAFGLPLVQHLMASPVRPLPKSVHALILAPTRELVSQIARNLKGFARGTPLSVATVVGGAGIGPQIKTLSRGADVLVATPGRLIDLMERRAVTLRDARFLVLDEADQMLDMGFIHALRQIAPKLATPRQTMLFSATMPKLMGEIAGTYLNDPLRIEVSPPGRAADKVEQSVHFVTDQKDKTERLIELLSERPRDLSLVFARTKHGAEKLMKTLVAAGIDAASIHGNKSQGQRERAIGAFRAGTVRVLVATDVAARGIDIPGVSHVYNFDLPEVAEAYVHRIGRTARAGADGQAVALCAPAEIGLLRAIERLTKISVPVVAGEVPPDSAAEAPRRGRQQQGRQQQGRGQKPGRRAGPKPERQARPDAATSKPGGKRRRGRKGGGADAGAASNVVQMPVRAAGEERPRKAAKPAAKKAAPLPEGFRPKGWRVRQKASA